MLTRVETPGDMSVIHAVHLDVFPTAAEAELVDRLRADGDATFSLVAVDSERVVGHVMFSRMGAPPATLGLGPVAVLEEYRRKGFAASLIRDGLQRAREAGWKAVFVLGGEYYRRFGFDPAYTAALRSRYAGPHLMGLALEPDWHPASQAALEYAPAFAAVGL